MLDNRSFYLGATITTLVFLFLVILPESINTYFDGYPVLSLQVGLYLTSLSMGTLLLNGFRDKVTCIWLALGMLVNYSVYEYQMINAQGPDDYSIAALQGTLVWAILLFSRHQISKRLFFVLGIVPTFRTVARKYLKATPPSLFQKVIDYYIVCFLLFDVLFTLLWRGLPIYFGELVDGSLRKTFDFHGWPNLFPIYYDFNNLIVLALIVIVPTFILIESISLKSP